MPSEYFLHYDQQRIAPTKQEPFHLPYLMKLPLSPLSFMACGRKNRVYYIVLILIYSVVADRPIYRDAGTITFRIFIIHTVGSFFYYYNFFILRTTIRILISFFLFLYYYYYHSLLYLSIRLLFHMIVEPHTTTTTTTNTTMTDDDMASTNNGPFATTSVACCVACSTFSTVFDGAKLIPQNFAAASPKAAVPDEGNR